jgi:adenylate kinase family enzyme
MTVLNITEYDRIAVVGNNGSGKSYLSRELSAITGLPLVHLDVEFWRPNWEMPSKEEWIARQAELVSKDQWIIDGTHQATMELRFKAADLVIFLDINRLVCLYSVLVRNGRKRTDMPQYLQEKLDRPFFQFCRRLWNFPAAGERTIMGLHEKYLDTPFLVIKGRRRMKKLLRQWRDETASIRSHDAPAHRRSALGHQKNLRRA